MPEFLKSIIFLALLTAAVVVILSLLGGIQYFMLKYGFEIVFAAFLTFVGWIAYGTFKGKKWK